MKADLNVFIDGIVYQWQLYGGISRLYNEVLPRMCNLDSSLHITLFTEGSFTQSLPEHSRIIHKAIPSVNHFFRPGRVWKPIIQVPKRYVRRLWIGRGNGKIWHSTYYTLPEPWDGWQVATVVDMIHERFVDLFNEPKNNLFRERKRHCLQKADAVICISETTRRDLQNFYGLESENIYVIPLACSEVFEQLKQLDESSKPQAEQPFLLYVGDRNHYKNFDTLIRAYSIWSHLKEVALVVVGSPWSSGEKQCLSKLRLRDYVQLITNVDDKELCQLYNQAVAFVYPSLYEGFGIPLLEAMACGCPIVASHIPSTIEVAGDCPIYFDPSEVDSLLVALDITVSKGRDSEGVQSGFRQVEQYSWDDTAKKTLEVYHALC